MLWQPSLPKAYRTMPTGDLARRISERRRTLGDRLVILGHHYQADEVVRHADLRGDSLKLSQLAARVAEEKPVEFIIFCGVHFMAETADMLSPDSVQVILPDMSAGCSMADMASYDDTYDAWEDIHAELNQQGWNGRIVPITYVNSTAAIKAFVGQHGGACCTSSNADRVFEWAMAGGDHEHFGGPPAEGEDVKILFLPDQHLGRNTAAKFGINVEHHTALYDPKKANRGEALGGMTPEQLADAEVVLWAGHCSVHKLFRPEHVEQIRAEEADLPEHERTKVLVHPECTKEVVDLADLAGSTEFIINTIEAAEPGSKWAIGTEVHLVNRLAAEAKARGVHARILSDCQCLCTTMYRIDEPHLLWTLDGLLGIMTRAKDDDAYDDSPDSSLKGDPIVRNVVGVHPEAQQLAVLALNRMLDLVSPAAATTD